MGNKDVDTLAETDEKTMAYRQCMLWLWLIIAAIFVIVYVPVGVVQWRPKSEAFHSLQQCVPCVVLNSSLTVAVECPTNECALKYKLLVLVTTAADAAAEPNCPNRTLLWEALGGPYSGNFSDATLLAKYPAGSSLDSCHWSNSTLLPCDALCMTTDAADALMKTVIDDVMTITLMFGLAAFLTAMFSCGCAPCCYEQCCK